MPRPPGRLVSSSLSESEKLSRCSERAALIYALTLPQHDGEGRLQVDDVSMLDMLGRFAITHGWHVREMPALREEIGDSGLWRLYQTKSGKVCAEVTDWHKHQRTDKIRRGSNLADEAGGICGMDTADGYAGGIPGPREGKGREENLRQEKSESTRARISEEDAGNGKDRATSAADTIGCRNAEWPYARGPIFDDFRLAIDRPEWGPSAVDESAGRNAVALLQDIPARAEQLREGHRRAISDGKKHTHLFADTVQELRNGDCSRPKRETSGLEPATGPPDWWVKAAEERGMR